MKNEQIKIDIALIPDYVRDELAASTLDFVRGFLRQPGGREALDTKTSARKSKKMRKSSADFEPQTEPQKPILTE